MDEKLDRFRPSPEVINNIRRQLVNAGIALEAIPHDWLVAIVAAMTKWECQTQSGMEFVVNLLGFQWKQGEDDKDYTYIYEGKEHSIPSNKITFFSGAAAFGKPINPVNLLTEKKHHKNCESCGIQAHCIKDYRDASKDSFEGLCNACASYSDVAQIQAQTSLRVCQDCTCTSCYHHEKNRARKIV